jgi:manganese/zinc/iron transport system permease protein
MFLISLLVSPKNRIWSKLKLSTLHLKVFDENILKYLFKNQNETSVLTPISLIELLAKEHKRTFKVTEKSLSRLTSEGYIQKNNDVVTLTKEGISKAQRLVKLHRLWEVYLVEHVHIAPDHVHEDAESLEHIITPEIERKLEELLHFPEHCPHQKTIPYSVGS